jgi:ankyrin repeat protein
MPHSKKKRGQAARGQPAGGEHLLDAALEGDGAAVVHLLDAGADPNASVTGRNASGVTAQTTVLCVAAGNGWLEAARMLLEGGADPSLAGCNGDTPLMAATGGGHLEVLRLLLGRGAAVDAVNPGTGCTAFHAACGQNKPGCAEALARAGCDVGLKTKSGQTGWGLAEARGHAAVGERLRRGLVDQVRGPAPQPVQELTLAAVEGDAAAVARLLAAGGDPNASASLRLPSGVVIQTTALCMTAANGRLEVARLLLDAGADPSLAGSDAATPLIAAAARGHLGVLRLLLARGAAVDVMQPDTGSTAFHHACYSNQPECAEALALAGCDVRLKDGGGFTGRGLAEEKGHAAVVERLRAAVAEQLRGAQAAGPAPEPAQLDVTDMQLKKAELELTKLEQKLAQQAVVFAEQALALAAADGDVAAVARLLAARADPNASVAARNAKAAIQSTAPHGTVARCHLQRALCLAATHGRLEVVQLLLEGGADPSLADVPDRELLDGGSITPLMAAAGDGQLEVLRLLLSRGATVDAVEPATGSTAFHCACANNQPDCAEALARAGCDVGIKNSKTANSGKTGRQIAEARGSKEVARRLRALARQPFVGVLVELAGLVGAAEHNGKRATVMSTLPSRSHHASAFLARASCLRSLCASIEERYVRQSSGGGIDHPLLPPHSHCGARCCATWRRSSATRSSCWSRRPGAAARASAWTCGRRTLCWRTCRPARGAPGPGGCIGSHRCSLVFVTSALTGLDSRVSNGPC